MAAVAGNDEQRFAQLFADEQLSAQALYDALSDVGFEHFVKYVFERAGYLVDYTALQRGPGLDLKVLHGTAGERSLHAGVQVKHYRPSLEPTKVSAPEVVGLRGGLPQTPDVTGYFVTTSVFNDQALAEAKRGRRIWPIDGDHLLRYIGYVRGSRPTIRASQSGAHQSGLPLAPISPAALFAADTMEWRPPRLTRVVTLANP